MPQETIIDISQIRHDKRNFNKGTDEGKQMMEQSFQQHGAGRSILLDKDNNIIAGNKSTSAARKAGIKRVRVIETTGDELIAVKHTDLSIDSPEGREMALLDNRTAQVNLAWDEVELAAVTAELDGFDACTFGFEIDTSDMAAPSLKDQLREDMKKRKAWGKAKDYTEPVCDMKDRLYLHRRDTFFYTSSFKRSDEGVPISEIKTEKNVEVFAQEAASVARGLAQMSNRADWCLLTTAKRRHKEKNFAAMVCDRLSQLLGIPFYDDAISAHGRDRINPDFRLEREIGERNILLYDDIVTTGSTLRHTVALFTGKNIVCIVGIDNN